MVSEMHGLRRHRRPFSATRATHMCGSIWVAALDLVSDPPRCSHPRLQPQPLLEQRALLVIVDVGGDGFFRLSLDAWGINTTEY